MKRKLLRISVILIFSGTLMAQYVSPDWKQELKHEVALYGHRNWILVVDAAYPMQNKPAIKTILTGVEQLDVVREVLDALNKSSHVNPEIYLDKEIDYVPEEEANGINDYKKKLLKELEGITIKKELHEELIAKIDEAAKTFNVLVLKTNLTIPYTSVFFYLDCGYWNMEQEKKMRELMK